MKIEYEAGINEVQEDSKIVAGIQCPLPYDDVQKVSCIVLFRKSERTCVNHKKAFQVVPLDGSPRAVTHTADAAPSREIRWLPTD